MKQNVETVKTQRISREQHKVDNWLYLHPDVENIKYLILVYIYIYWYNMFVTASILILRHHMQSCTVEVRLSVEKHYRTSILPGYIHKRGMQSN